MMRRCLDPRGCQPHQRSAQAETRLCVRALAPYSRRVCTHSKGSVVRQHCAGGIHKHCDSVGDNAIVSCNGAGVSEQGKVRLLRVKISDAQAVECLARGLQLGRAYQQRNSGRMPPSLHVQ